MPSESVGVYGLSLVVLFVKFFGTITVQSIERLRSRQFRYAEDAAQWNGTVDEDSERCLRATNLLRNDAESQIWYVGLGTAYLWLGAWPAGAPYYFVAYCVSRVAHGYFLIAGRQPHRNRAFSVGIAVLFALAGHFVFECVSQLGEQ